MTKFGTVIADPPWEYAATSKTKMPTKGSAKLSGYSDEVYPSMTTDDLRGLTPLIYTHVNPYGTFSLNLAERLALDPEEAAA